MTGSRLSPSAIFLSSSPQSYNLPPSFVLYEPLSSLSVRIRLLRWLRPVTVPIIIVAVAFDYWKAVPFRNFLVNLEVSFLLSSVLNSTFSSPRYFGSGDNNDLSRTFSADNFG